MEILDPLAVGHIALSPGHVLHVLCVDEKYLNASSFQNLIERYPVHAGRFHRNCGHSTLLQPVSELMEVTRKCVE